MTDYQLERLTEVIEATEITSPSSFRYADQTYEAGPDAMTGQFGGMANPVPILPILANYLYGYGYCARPSERAWEPADDPGKDLTKQLSSANNGTDRRHDGWHVTYAEPSAGYVVVQRRGLTRYVPAGDFVPADASRPVAVGDAISIWSRRENHQGGFYNANGDALDSSMETQSPLRFYWNAPAGTVVKLMRVLTATLNGAEIPFSFKVPPNAAACTRYDSGTLYVFRRWLGRALPHVTSIYHAVAGGMDDDTPLFAKRLAPGLAFAEDPGGGESFGTHRCRVLAEAMWTAYAAGLTGTAERLGEVRRQFRRNGLNIEAAHVNAWHLDRFADLEVA